MVTLPGIIFFPSTSWNAVFRAEIWYTDCLACGQTKVSSLVPSKFPQALPGMILVCWSMSNSSEQLGVFSKIKQKKREEEEKEKRKKEEKWHFSCICLSNDFCRFWTQIVCSNMGRGAKKKKNLVGKSPPTGYEFEHEQWPASSPPTSFCTPAPVLAHMCWREKSWKITQKLKFWTLSLTKWHTTVLRAYSSYMFKEAEVLGVESRLTE